MVSMSRKFVERFIGGFVFIITTTELEQYTDIGNQYPMAYKIAKFMTYFVLLFLYDIYR